MFADCSFLRNSAMVSARPFHDDEEDDEVEVEVEVDDDDEEEDDEVEEAGVSS